MNNKKQILEGSRAIALAIKNISPAVISAYPITPQTHIVEDLAKFKADGEANYEYRRAESEFAAASIVLGASATGARVYSATSSQGLLLMTEVVYNIAGLRLPVVMTCANRAVSGPINIWNDHSDVMSIRDAGWIQLFAADHQEAVNQHILAYKLAEKLKLPVMVNVDGFILTHSYEPVLIPTGQKIKKYLPTYRPSDGTYLNPKNPVTLGAFFTPDDYLETREALHNDLRNSLETIKKEYQVFQRAFRAESANDRNHKNDNGLWTYYGPAKPKTLLIAMGSAVGTLREAIKSNPTVGVLKIKVYRPFPAAEIATVMARAKNIAVIEKAVSLGQAGPLYSDIKAGLKPTAIKNLNIKNYIVGLGGRDFTQKMIAAIIRDLPRKNEIIKFIGKI
ncbi:TPA: pyruvate ferredoxin oxidoreductase [Candidatus Falkowbacteria bacterium]|nr:MAG: Pyruvate ferredoxin oxidoreductase alpha subunit [Candidatus Falkowbacteria bacterium GW2011_GWF2_43_32]HBA36627.1 pyruvate ferredoxin oxidoreductase [Candidatus Falkowbacteria bacterium]